MKEIMVVLQRDFRELRQTNAFGILAIASVIVAFGAAVGISVAFRHQPWLSQESAQPILNLIIGIPAYFISFFILLAFIWAFASLSITKEKVSGNIDSLLATPLSPRSIWLAKTLAIFLPGFIVSGTAALIMLLGISYLVIVPAIGSIILPVPVLLITFLINPLLFFGMLSFIVLFSLANNPDVAIAPSFLVGFGLMIGMPLGIMTGAINLASWAFSLWYLAATIVVWVIVLWLTRLLTKENIVLSSKGD
jgi:ABC-type Na+ efflux pump permease subunit